MAVTTRRRRAAGPARRLGGDDGSAAVEFAVVMPLLALLLVSLLQVGLWFHARQVATGAARHALEAARRSEGGTTVGEQAGRGWLTGVGDDTLRDPQVVVADGTMVTVTVTGEALTVLPGRWQVRVALSGPREEPVP